MGREPAKLRAPRGDPGRRVCGIRVHVSCLRNGDAVLARDLDKRLPQAQRVFNAHDVGIEMEGYYAGVDGDLRTFWRPRSRPNRQPMVPTEGLVHAARDAVVMICETVADQGGEIRYVHAHRQTANSRISDPGELLWKAVGIWAQDALGLSDGGPDFYVKRGRPIPREWDPRRVHPYRHRPKAPGRAK